MPSGVHGFYMEEFFENQDRLLLPGGVRGDGRKTKFIGV